MLSKKKKSNISTRKGTCDFPRGDIKAYVCYSYFEQKILFDYFQK